jgi:hypothetical protein
LYALELLGSFRVTDVKLIGDCMINFDNCDFIVKEEIEKVMDCAY